MKKAWYFVLVGILVLISLNLVVGEDCFQSQIFTDKCSQNQIVRNINVECEEPADCNCYWVPVETSSLNPLSKFFGNFLEILGLEQQNSVIANNEDYDVSGILVYEIIKEDGFIVDSYDQEIILPVKTTISLATGKIISTSSESYNIGDKIAVGFNGRIFVINNDNEELFAKVYFMDKDSNIVNFSLSPLGNNLETLGSSGLEPGGKSGERVCKTPEEKSDTQNGFVGPKDCKVSNPCSQLSCGKTRDENGNIIRCGECDSCTSCSLTNKIAKTFTLPRPFADEFIFIEFSYPKIDGVNMNADYEQNNGVINFILAIDSELEDELIEGITITFTGIISGRKITRYYGPILIPKKNSGCKPVPQECTSTCECSGDDDCPTGKTCDTNSASNGRCIVSDGKTGLCATEKPSKRCCLCLYEEVPECDKFNNPLTDWKNLLNICSRSYTFCGYSKIPSTREEACNNLLINSIKDCKWDSKLNSCISKFKEICLNQKEKLYDPINPEKQMCDNFIIISDSKIPGGVFPDNCRLIRYIRAGHGRSCEELGENIHACLKCIRGGCRLIAQDLGCSTFENHQEALDLSYLIREKLEPGDEVSLTAQQADSASSLRCFSDMYFFITPDSVTVNYISCNKLGVFIDGDHLCITPHQTVTCEDPRGLVEKMCCPKHGGKYNTWETIDKNKQVCEGQKKTTGVCEGSANDEDAAIDILNKCIDKEEYSCLGKSNPFFEYGEINSKYENREYIITRSWTCIADL